MFRQKGDTSTTIISVALIFIILGGVFFFTTVRDKAFLNKPAVDIYEVDDWSTLKAGTHVTFDLRMVWDEYYSSVETRSTMGVKTSERETGRGYMIPQIVYNSSYGDYEIGSFIGTEVSDYTTFNKMIAETGEWYEEWLYTNANPDDYCKTTYKIDGKLRKMKKDEQKLMVEYLMSSSMSQSEAEAYIVPLMIENIRYNGIFIPVGLVFIVVGVVLIVAVVLAKKKSSNDFYGASINTSTSVSKEEPQYYGPEGLAAAPTKTYQYGGTNTYGTSDIYSSSYTGSGASVDGSTGLSSDFLQREQAAQADRARQEANQRAMEANAAVYAANPLFGNEPAQAPMPASQSFSSYNQVANPAANNIYAEAPAYNPVPPVQEAYLGGTPVQPAYSQPTYTQPQFTPAPPVQESYLGGTPAQPAYNPVPPVQEAYLGGTPVQPQFTPAPPVQESYLGGSPAAQQPVMPQTPPDGSAPVQLPSGNGLYADNPGNKNYL